MEVRLIARNKKADALHDLICAMLRGRHIQSMSSEDLRAFVYQAGVVLHNLPYCLDGENEVEAYQLAEINELDPSGSKTKWGPWATCFAREAGIPLPLLAAKVEVEVQK